MPTYIFRRPDGTTEEVAMSIEEYERLSFPRGDGTTGITLPDGTAAVRDIAAEYAKPRRGGCASWPMLSEAAGVMPEQAAEAHAESVRLGVETEFTRDGRAVFRDATHRRKYLRAIGMYDRNAGYGDPVPD
jgi:hypothetical protein